MKFSPVFVLIFLVVSSASAAPLPDMGKVTITGTVIRAKWVPEQSVKGEPGLSGSAGRDRVFPARIEAVLKPYSGPSAKQARMMNAILGVKATPSSDRSQLPAKLLIRLDTKDPAFLKPGMKVTLTGYAIGGDEGGTWTTVERVERTDPAKP